MFNNYLKIAWRNLWKHKLFSAINITGLTLGLIACMLMSLLIRYEYGFDSFHNQKDRIYRIVREEQNASGKDFSASVPYPMGEVLINDYPELRAVAQIFNQDTYSIKHKENIWSQKQVLFADSSFFKVFDFELIEGSPLTALKHPSGVLVTEETAAQFFGNASPIGEIITMPNLLDLEIVGVVKDPPPNSHLPFSMIISFQALNDNLVGGIKLDSWGAMLGVQNYVVLPPGMLQSEFEKRLASIPAKYHQDQEGTSIEYRLQPLRKIHFDKIFASSNASYTVNNNYLWVLGCIAFFMIIIACVNFINLATAKAMVKSKEVGVRKALGATKSQIVYQNLVEAFILTTISMILATIGTRWLLPVLNDFMEVQIHLDILLHPSVIFYLLGIIMLVGFASGMYPSLVLSKYQPVEAIKNTFNNQRKPSGLLRKGLVAFQFLLAQILIIATLVMAQQMKYFHDKPLGFNKELIVTAQISDNERSKLETFASKLSAYANIQQVSFGTGAPTSQNDIGTDFNLKGKDQQLSTRFKTVDFNYKETYGLELIAGSWFTSDHQTSENLEFIVNETSVNNLGFSKPQEALGEIVMLGLNNIEGPIVGVTKDFHTTSLHEAIEPVLLFQFAPLYFEVGIKISGGDIPETLAFIDKEWQQVFPGDVFNYTFLEDALAANYQRETKTYGLSRIFSSISIFIGCLGLIGLVTFIITQKTKEVAIRKVLGASVRSIIFMFSKEFISIIAIAFLLAAPVTWWLMRSWLNGFAYKIDLSPVIFLNGALITLVIAMITVSLKLAKAAYSNPTDYLKE